MNLLDFSPPKRRQTGSDAQIVPMINVVFLLLIFFLMTAQIAPPDPIDVTVPDASTAEQSKRPDVLYIGADGSLAYGDIRGPLSLAASSKALKEQLEIRADGALPANVLTSVLRDLAGLGQTDVALITAPVSQ